MKDVFGQEMDAAHEYIVCCDESGNVIGPMEKLQAHEPGTRQENVHFSTWCMVYNTKTQKYGLQYKVAKKYSKAKWDMGVAGHNTFEKNGVTWSEMNFEETMVKEAEEEVGLAVEIAANIDELRTLAGQDKTVGYIFDTFHHKTALNNEFIGLGIIMTSSTTVEFVDGEVEEFRWLDRNEVEQFIQENENVSEALILALKKTETFLEHYAA